MKNLICPICNKPVDKGALTNKEKDFVIRGEHIHVNMECYQCKECGEEFIVPGKQPDAFEQAYNIYRKNHQLLQPDEILSFRRKYGLTQIQLARLLGIGVATLSRYETGSLQTEAHDRILRFLMKPENLIDSINEHSDIFPDEEKRLLLDKIKESIGSESELIESCVMRNLFNSGPDEFNGYKQFDNEKFTNLVLYFCKEGVVKTKLNKLLFYTDFKYFKENVLSITGAEYAHIPFGPAPNHFDLLYPILVRKGLIEIEEIEYPEYSGELLKSTKEPNLNNFNETELIVLASVKNFFKLKNASAISRYSHSEEGYQKTKNGELISYSFARSLSI